MALAAVLLAERGESGLVHVAGPETIPRPDFARSIAYAFDLNPDLIQSKPTAELAQGAPRPLKGGLATPRLDSLLPGVMKPLEDALADFRRRTTNDEGWLNPLSQA